MPNIHLIRVGSFGMVGRFLADGQQLYARGSRVVCRTGRGLEVGEVLAHVAQVDEPHELDGELIRPLSARDESQLVARAQLCDRAVEACQRLLDRSYAPVIVVDAVCPLDGQSICFYVLGDLADVGEATARELQRQFHVSVTFQSVAEEPAAGCGSGCCSAPTRGGCTGRACATCPAVNACRRNAE